MKTRELYFYSNGYKLKAALFLPDDYKEGSKLPCLIPNSGYMGLLNIYPELFARAFTKLGYAVFGFDYRGFLSNEGPAGVCKIEEQVEDIRNAITFAKTLPEVDTDDMVLLGWGMAAGMVMKAASLEPSIKAVAGLNGFYNGERWLKSVNTYADFVATHDKGRRAQVCKSVPLLSVRPCNKCCCKGQSLYSERLRPGNIS